MRSGKTQFSVSGFKKLKLEIVKVVLKHETS